MQQLAKIYKNQEQYNSLDILVNKDNYLSSLSDYCVQLVQIKLSLLELAYRPHTWRNLKQRSMPYPIWDSPIRSSWLLKQCKTHVQQDANIKGQLKVPLVVENVVPENVIVQLGNQFKQRFKNNIYFTKLYKNTGFDSLVISVPKMISLL